MWKKRPWPSLRWNYCLGIFWRKVALLQTSQLDDLRPGPDSNRVHSKQTPKRYSLSLFSLMSSLNAINDPRHMIPIHITTMTSCHLTDSLRHSDHKLVLSSVYKLNHFLWSLQQRILDRVDGISLHNCQC
jgi:hypothetical protein